MSRTLPPAPVVKNNWRTTGATVTGSAAPRCAPVALPPLGGSTGATGAKGVPGRRVSQLNSLARDRRRGRR